MSEDPLVKCPQCRKNGLKRLIGGGMGIIFKGSGFYVTDSRGGRGSTKPAGEKSSEPVKTAEAAGSAEAAGAASSSGEKKTETGAKADAKAAS